MKKSIIVVWICLQTAHSFCQTHAEKLGKAAIDYVDAIAWASAIKESKCTRNISLASKWTNTDAAIAEVIKTSLPYTTVEQRRIMLKDLNYLVDLSKGQNREFYKSIPPDKCEIVATQFIIEFDKRVKKWKSLN